MLKQEEEREEIKEEGQEKKEADDAEIQEKVTDRLSSQTFVDNSQQRQITFDLVCPQLRTVGNVDRSEFFVSEQFQFYIV